ncbi:hypothetical protein B0H21DRAFT_781837 [Amylocystis lapponica]|nr:hypothetical protein B0H21DRAFT_781837 [Amylocystis lapponica]
MQWGLANLASDAQDHAYVVQHGRQAISQAHISNPDGPNFWEKAFPVLFPYGTGGIEADRPSNVSFIGHVRWLLQQHDRCFRLHPTFSFLALGILQRRQALGSARIQMGRTDLLADARILFTITVQDLVEAAAQEEKGEPITNNTVRLLKRCVHATASKVSGSDASRVALCTQIWSTSIWMNPANVWLTINPDDLHDPIAQLFVGETINMDAFIATMGPDKQRRARNIAPDGFAAAKFFHFIIHTTLQTLFGVDIVARGSKVESGIGILGRVSAYFGTVESQAAHHFQRAEHHRMAWRCTNWSFKSHGRSNFTLVGQAVCGATSRVF